MPEAKKQKKKLTKKNNTAVSAQKKQTENKGDAQPFESTTTDYNLSESIKVDIRSRKEQFFSGEAKTVTSLNDTGEFDVLPQHANFVTLIRSFVVIDKGMPTEKKFKIDNGVLAAKTGAVDIYLDF